MKGSNENVREQMRASHSSFSSLKQSKYSDSTAQTNYKIETTQRRHGQVFITNTRRIQNWILSFLRKVIRKKSQLETI